MSVRVLFFHGLESTAFTSKKARYLELRGYDVFTPDLPIEDLREWARKNPPAQYPDGLLQDAREVADAAYMAWRPDVIVGSSFGGGLAVDLLGHAPMVLLAPAVHRFPSEYRHLYARTHIIHGSQDTIVPCACSQVLQEQNSDFATLEIVNDGHRLSSVIEPHNPQGPSLLDLAIRRVVEEYRIA